MQARLQQQAQWSHLPLNLWARVFTDMKPVGFAPAENSLAFHQLRTVCSAFNATFKQHDDLYSDIIVRDHKDRHLSSLAAWICCHSSSIRNLTVLMPSPWLEAIFVALQSPHHSCLETLFIVGPVPATAMHLLPSFQSITKLVVHDHETPLLDLHPLKDLPQLTHLDLQQGIEVAEHLTALDLYQTRVVCEQGCSFVTSLVHLTMWYAALAGFHQKGLPACSCLQSLTCRDGDISAVDANEGLLCSSDTELSIPSSMTALTALTKLAIGTDACSGDPVNLGWLTQLTALRCIEVSLPTSEVEFPQCVSTMTSIRTLLVDLHYSTPTADTADLRLDFDMSGLVSLQSFTLKRLSVIAHEMRRLTLVQGLKQVVLKDVVPADARTAQEIAMLAFEIGHNQCSTVFDMSVAHV